MAVKIGILALQGDFAEHIAMLKNLGVATAEKYACQNSWKIWMV